MSIRAQNRLVNAILLMWFALTMLFLMYGLSGVGGR